METDIAPLGITSMRQLLGEFATRVDAYHEAKSFSRNSGLATEVIDHGGKHFVIVRSEGACASVPWQSIFNPPFEEFFEDSPEELEYFKWRNESIDFLLGGPSEVPGLPGGNQSRIFKENFKNPAIFRERMASPRYLLLQETFEIAGVKRRKLLDLGQAVSFSLVHLKGVTPRVALYSTISALHALHVKFDVKDVIRGPLETERLGILLDVTDQIYSDLQLITSDVGVGRDLYETYRGAFYALRRRKWSGIVYNLGKSWCVSDFK